jgi:hypothetical protein
MTARIQPSSLLVDLVRGISSTLADVDGSAVSIAETLELETARDLARRWLAEQVKGVMREETLAAERAADAERQRKFDERNSRPEVVAERERRDHEYAEERDAIRERHWARMHQLVSDFAMDLRLQWTAELLASEFALPDGSAVTWGDATVEQHEARREMFAANAVANVEGAARHKAAITALTSADAKCLNDLVVTA